MKPDAKLTASVWWTASGAFVAGALIVAAGALIPCLGDYVRSIFVNVGTALALIAPLYLGERMLSQRIRSAADTAEAARSSAADASSSADRALEQVGELGAQVRARLDELRDERQDLGRQAAEGEREALVALYYDAARNHKIDRLGLRLPAPGDLGVLDFWLRIRVIPRHDEDGGPIDLVELSLEAQPFSVVGDTVLWSAGEPPSEVFVRWAVSIQNAGGWHGDDAFQPEEVLAAIERALSRIVDHRTGSAGDPRTRQITTLVNDEWAVSREGLDSLRTPDVFADRGELAPEVSHLTFQRLESQVKLLGWDELTFREAFGEAERVHAFFRKQSPGDSPFR